MAKVTSWGTDPAPGALCGFGGKNARRKPTSPQVMGRDPAGHSKQVLDGSTILRKFIYVIMTQILYHISHQEVKSTSPTLESGLAMGLVLTNR